MTNFKLFTAEIVVEVVQRFKEQYERCQGDENAIANLKQKISKALQVQDMEQEISKALQVQDMEQESATEDILTFALSQDVSLEMIKVKAGTFMMGSPEDEIERDDDEKLHKVTLTQDYWLGKFPVTQAQFQAIMKYNPSTFSDSQLPVEEVDWNCAKDFCVRLNKKFKDKLPEGYQFDLPTEAQWEYACRAGSTTAYFWGNSCNGTEANCDGNYPCGTTAEGPYLERTTDVGSYMPNDWGFYDMHGNVEELCRDWYNDDYGEDATDPTGPEDGLDRVVRGGGWCDDAEDCRSARRDYFSPGDCHSYVGFRLALVKL